MNGKEFVKIIEKDNEDLFVQSSGRVYEFFSKKPSDEEMSEYFTSRLVNERALCVEAAERVANLPADTSPEEMFLLCKQAMDEAKHFRFVKKAMEHLSGKEVDVAAAIEKIRVRNEKNGTGNPATLIKKYEGTTDKLAYALYQFIAEGRAARNWEALAECAPYDIIRKYYSEIAKDENFHANIGRFHLEELCNSTEVQQQALKLAEEIRADLYQVGCAKNIEKIENSLLN
jgi:rubrerythrin